MSKLIWEKIYFDKIDSTNLKAREIASEVEEGTVIIANQQLSGKGRLGRSWVSVKDKGIYMSIILKPNLNLEDISKVTLIGAGAVNQALRNIGIESQIKWPNDIIIDGKKVCGILAEMQYEANRVEYVIMGIGINVNLDIEDISQELIKKTTSLKIETGRLINKDELIELVLEEIEDLYLDFIKNKNISKTIEICKEYSAILGKEIRVINGEKTRIGKAIDIGADGELLVEFDTGIEPIISGEISIRGLDSYI